jgi:hypothetical protein
MSQTLEYSGKRPRVRWVNLVAIPVCVALVIAFAFLGPTIAMRWRHLPRLIGNALFFLPQTCFPYRGLVWNEGLGGGSVLNDATAQALGIMQWIVVAAAPTYFLRRMRLRFAAPLVVAVTLLIAIAGPLVFEPFGMYVQLDGP